MPVQRLTLAGWLAITYAVLGIPFFALSAALSSLSGDGSENRESVTDACYFCSCHISYLVAKKLTQYALKLSGYGHLYKPNNLADCGECRNYHWGNSIPLRPTFPRGNAISHPRYVGFTSVGCSDGLSVYHVRYQASAVTRPIAWHAKAVCLYDYGCGFLLRDYCARPLRASYRAHQLYHSRNYLYTRRRELNRSCNLTSAYR